MGFVLVDESRSGVVRLGSQEGFELGSGFAEGLVDGLMHRKFGVDEKSKEFESVAVAVAGVNYAELFFERVEGYSVSSAPCMN